VAEKMLEKQVSRLITLDQQNHPVGVISFRDFFRISLSLGSEEDVMEASALSGNASRGFLSEGSFGGISQAKDVMTRGLISVPFHEDLADASKKIIQNKINGLGVLDGNEALAGIISKTDIIRAITTIN